MRTDPLKVIIVDETAPTRRRLHELLSELPGIDVAEAGVEEGLVVMIAELKPRVVVIDVPVRDARGYQVLGAIRAAAPAAVLVVLTNHATAEFQRRSEAVGVDHFLEKANDLDQLVELVGGLRSRP